MAETFDLSTVVQLITYALGVAGLYWALKYRIDNLAKDKVEKLECVKHHSDLREVLNRIEADLRERLARIDAGVRVNRGGIRVMHDGFKQAGAVKNPPKLPPEFYEDDE